MEFLILLLMMVIVSGKVTIMIGESKKYKVLKYIKYLIPLGFFIMAYNGYIGMNSIDCDGWGCLGTDFIQMSLVCFYIGQFIFTLGACIITSIKYNNKKDDKSNDKFTVIHIILVNILIYLFTIAFMASIFSGIK